MGRQSSGSVALPLPLRPGEAVSSRSADPGTAAGRLGMLSVEDFLDLLFVHIRHKGNAADRSGFRSQRRNVVA